MTGKIILAAIVVLSLWLCSTAHASITDARRAADRQVARAHTAERWDYRRPTVYHHGADTATTAAGAWRVAIAWADLAGRRARAAAADASCGPWLCYQLVGRAFARYGPAAVARARYIISRESKYQRAVCNPGVPCPNPPRTACGLSQIMPEHGLGYACTNALVNLHWMTAHVARGDWHPWDL